MTIAYRHRRRKRINGVISIGWLAAAMAAKPGGGSWRQLGGVG
jgi:hypothetical protein